MFRLFSQRLRLAGYGNHRVTVVPRRHFSRCEETKTLTMHASGNHYVTSHSESEHLADIYGQRGRASRIPHVNRNAASGAAVFRMIPDQPS